MSRSTLILLLATWAMPLLAAPTPKAVPFELTGLNRTYEDIVQGLDPWEQGGVTVRLKSPHHRLTLFGHRIWMRPSSRGHLLVNVDLDFEASGDVIADLEMGRISQRFDDHLVAPRQERSLHGEIEIARVEAGYRITTLRLPRYFSVRVESRLTDSLIESCHQMAILPFMPLDCKSFARILSELEVELPAAGTSYLLPDSELSKKERGFLDSFLASRPSSPP